MAISINWATKVIFVPQSYLTSLGGDRWELDVDQFRLDLKDLEDSEDGMAFPDTHRHNTEVTLSGVTYARTFEIINGYTVEFEDMGPHYTVVCSGANHNLGDVVVPGATHLIIGNAAGLIVKSIGSGLSGEEHDAVMQIPGIDTNLDTVDSNIDLVISYIKNKKALAKIGSTWHLRIYGVDGVTPIIDKELKDKDVAEISDLVSGVLAIEGASLV